MTDDSELLRLYARDGSQAAFTEFVQRHFGLVYGSAQRRTGSHALAAEIAQDVFTQAARRAGGLAGHDLIPAWLFTATRNAASNALRSEGRRRMREAEAALMSDMINSDQAVDSRELRPVLDEMLDNLDRNERAAVLMRYFESRSFAEIGVQLQVTENTARMRVERALDKLQALLSRRGIKSTSAALGGALAGHAAEAIPAGLAGMVAQSAIAAASAPGALAGILGFMTTPKISGGIVGLALVLGLSLATNTYLFVTLPAGGRPVPGAAASADASMTSTGAKKAPIASPDGATGSLTIHANLVALRDEMRGAGVSDSTSRATIEGILRQRYRDQLTADREARYNRGWWKDERRVDGTPSRPRQPVDDPLLLRKMVTNPLEELFGVDPLDAAQADARYAFLPADLRTALGRFDRQRLAGYSPTGDPDIDLKLKAEYEGINRDADEKRKALLAQLTAEQQAEYDLRFGPFSTGLAGQLAQLSVTEQEFRAVQPLAQKYVHDLGELQAARIEGNSSDFAVNLAQQLVDSIGYDRALGFIWNGAPEFPLYSRVAREAGLSPDVPGAVLQLAAETAEQAARIHADPAIPLEQKRSALLDLQKAAREQLDAMIPPQAQSQLTPAALAWLTALGDGSYKFMSTVLPGQFNYLPASTPTIPLSAAVPASATTGRRLAGLRRPVGNNAQ